VVWPIRIGVLDAKDTGQFAIWDRKIKDAGALTRDLAARKKASGRKPRRVIVAAEPKTLWKNVVQACKAVEDAGFEDVGLWGNLEEHRYMPKPSKKVIEPAGERGDRIPQ